MTTEEREAQGLATLRSARRDDIPHMAAMMAAEHLPPLFIEEFLDGFVVAEREGAVIGCGGVEIYDSAAVIRSVVVTQEAKGLGLGRAISDALIQRARLAGCREVYLFTADAHAFWSHLGFVDVGIDEWTQAPRVCWQYAFISQRPQAVIRGTAPGDRGIRVTLKLGKGVTDDEVRELLAPLLAVEQADISIAPGALPDERHVEIAGKNEADWSNVFVGVSSMRMALADG